MNLFSILHSTRRRPSDSGGSRKLVPAWEYQTRGVVWRLLPAPGGLLVGEDRDNTSKSVSFFCLEEKTGNARWKNVAFKESWWIGIEAIHKNIVFFHEFARPDLPDHKKIIAVELDSARELWRNEELKFLYAHEDSVYASKERFETSLVFELDLLTGAVVRELGNETGYISVLRDTSTFKQNDDIEFPRPLATQNEFHKRVLRHIPSGKICGEVEILEKDAHIVVGYYENTSPNPFERELDQHLKFLDAETGDLLFRDVLTQKAKEPVPDLFFLRGDFIIYIKNKNVLRAVKLSNS